MLSARDVWQNNKLFQNAYVTSHIPLWGLRLFKPQDFKQIFIQHNLTLKFKDSTII